MSHRPNPPSSSSDDRGIGKLLDLDASIVIGGAAIQYFSKMLKSFDKDYVMPASGRQIVSDLKARMGIDLNDRRQRDYQMQKYRESSMNLPMRTEDSSTKLRIRQLAPVPNLPKHLDSKNLHDSNVREKKQNLASSSSNDQDFIDISLQFLDCGQLTQSDAQGLIKKMKSFDKDYVAPVSQSQIIWDVKTRLGIDLLMIRRQVNSARNSEESSMKLSDKHSQASAPTLPKNQENVHELSSSSSEDESDHDVSEDSRWSPMDLPKETLEWLLEKDETFLECVSGLSLSALLDLHKWEIEQKTSVPTVSNKNKDHGKIPSTSTVKNVEKQTNSGIEFWLKMMGFDEKKFSDIPVDSGSISDFVKRFDPKHVISVKEIHDFQMNLLDKYKEWLRDESPARDVKIRDSFQNLLPKFPENFDSRERMRFYADISKKFLSDFAIKSSEFKNTSGHPNLKDKSNGINVAESRQISTGGKLETPLLVGLGNLSIGSFQSNEKKVTGVEDSKKGDRKDLEMMKSSENSNTDSKAQLIEIGRKLDYLHKINADLRKENQSLVWQNQLLLLNFTKIENDKRMILKRVNELAIQIEKLTKSVEELKK